MKEVIMKRLLIAGIALLTVPSVFAQKEKEKEEKDKSDKKQVQTIVITRTADKDEKTVVEVKGDKITVNGKDVKDYKDGDVKVHSYINSNVYRVNGARAGQNFAWNDGNGSFSIFSEDENRAMLGVTTEGNDKGAEIESVTKESAAEKAGLKKGDIITKIGDRKIESTDDVTDAIRNHKPGDKVAVTFLRDGKTQTASAELTKWKGVRVNSFAPVPDMKFDMGDLNMKFREMMPMEGYAMGRPKLGLSVQDTDDGVGVKVLDVDDESAAAKAGIKDDDIILGVDDVDVKGTEDIVRATRASKDKNSYKFKIKRGNSTQTIDVKIPRKLKTADL
jgi:serine protease Do